MSRPDPAHALAIGLGRRGNGHAVGGYRFTTPHNPTNDNKPVPVTKAAAVTCWCERSVVSVPWWMVRDGLTVPCHRAACERLALNR